MAYVIDQDIDTILTYCGFATAANRLAIAEDGFGSALELSQLEEKDIDSLSDSFASRTQLLGKIIFGLRRKKRLKATLHWAQDFRRISRDLSLEGIVDAADFHVVIEVSRLRAEMRKQQRTDSAKLGAATEPGKLKRQKDWPTWIRALNNFLSTILGQDGVPLNYCIRDNEEADYSDEDNGNFEQLSIKCTPLTGLVFDADALKVHQLVQGFVQGETAETWVKPHERRKNGRVDVASLTAHYGGEGNKMVLIQEAETLRKNLTYKNERSMSFEKFLTSMQAMFNGFGNNDEPYTESQKVRLLFDKVEHLGLKSQKEALQITYNLDTGGVVTYDFIANSLSASVATLPDYTTPRQTSSVETYTGSAPGNGIRAADGKIYTGYYKKWFSLSQDDKKAVNDERSRLNVKPNSNRKPRGPRNRNASAVKGSNKQVDQLTRQIASLNTRVKDFEKKRSAADDDGNDPASDNAGDQFGGRAGKKARN
jgi:hypothetical protein